MNAITLRSLSKSYGATRALDGLDLDVGQGTICGVVGPNGAGKTTAFGIIAGLIRADQGTLDLLGDGPFDARRHRGRITLLPQDCALNPHLSVRELLRYFGALQGLPLREARVETDRVLELVGMGERGAMRITQLSHGMRRRIQIAQALLGNPELILLDEPTAGLDPELVVRIRDVIVDAGRDATVVISSHILSEVEAMCDTVVFMAGGRAVESGALADITGATAMSRLVLETPPPLAELEALGLPCTFAWEEPNLVVTRPEALSPAELHERLLPVLLAAGVGINEIQLGRSLEDSYLAHIGGQPAQPAPPISQ